MRHAVSAVLLAGVLTAAAPAPAERQAEGAGVPTTAASDGLILLTARRAGNWEVLSVAPDGTRLRNLSRSRARDVSPAWSPDGTKVAFVRVARESPPDPIELYVMNADGSGQRQLDGAGSSSEWPRWSPDGSTISFLEQTSFSSGGAATGEFFEIHLIDAADGPERRVAEGAGAGANASSWSPDSARLVFQRLRGGDRGAQELAIIDLANGRTRTLTSGSYPAWSPNGRWIAYSRTDGTYVIHPDGSGRRRLTRGRQEWGATWSPDGRKLAFVRQRPGTTGVHVYVMLANGSNLHRVSVDTGDVSTPLVWSPDGTRLAWSVGYNLGYILIARADGSGAPTKLMSGFVQGWKRTATRTS